ncbi:MULTISPECIES: patatin-like phospholipase family protein [Rufibacter]|uniref:NTE family protein n=1 Tax=Rufibacter quisquiliarum TaxID=1549639 RepID=A0A839G7P2_9BACT|nr:MULTISPECIES: patatin-like phospholipase family protein [Rufibacter]MBA9075444.1 NTE family protein [Rufibacter quisquiliarum]
MKNVRLVLGSGGARGMAHIGIIEELEKEGFCIKEVIGSSMGAVVGGIYCAGYLRQFRDWLLTLDKVGVFQLLDFTLSGEGFVKGERVFRTIEKLIGEHQIEQFKVPFTAVAVDVLNQEEVHYKTGSLFKALRASIAIPTLFTPAYEEGRQLVDGGVLNPLPVNLVTREPGDWVVAVNLNGNPPCPPAPTVFAETANQEKAAYLKMLSAWWEQSPAQVPPKKVAHLGLFDLLTKSLDMMQDKMADLMIHLHQPELVITIPRETCGIFEFYRAEELIDKGRQAFWEAYTAQQQSAG